MSWLEWYIKFAGENVYGFVPLLAIIYLVFLLLKIIFPKLPDPGYFVFVSFFILIFAAPPISRYLLNLLN